MKTTDEIIEYLYPGAKDLNRQKLSAYALRKLKHEISKVTRLEASRFDDEISDRAHVTSRQLLTVLLRIFTNLSLAEISFTAGKKDHATALFSIKKVAIFYETDKKYRDNFNKLISSAEIIFRDTSLGKPVRKRESGLSKEVWKYAYSMLIETKSVIPPVKNYEIAILKDTLRDKDREIRLLKGQIERSRIKNSYEYVD